MEFIIIIIIIYLFIY